MTRRLPNATPSEPIGRATVLSASDAAARLTGRVERARWWLRERGLLRVPPGADPSTRRRVVIWGDVLDVLSREGAPLRPARRPAARRAVMTGQEAQSDSMARWPRKIVVGDVTAAVKKARGRKDGLCYWQARQSIAGQRCVIWSGRATRAGAEQAILEAYQSQTPTVADGQRRRRVELDEFETVQEMIDSWVELRERMGLVSEGTIRQNRTRAVQVCKVLGALHPAEVTTSVVQGYVVKRGRDVGRGTLQQDIGVLRQAMEAARDSGRLDVRALPVWPRITYTPKRKSRAPSARTLRLLFAGLEHECGEVARGLRLQAHIGARTGELWALRWSDVEHDDGRVYVILDGKTNARRIPVSAEAVGVLELIRRFRSPTGPDDRIVTDRTYKGWCGRVDYVLRKLPWEEWGEQRPKPNDLRAMFSISLRDAGATPEVIKELAGHSAATAVESYWGATDQDLRSVVDRLGIGAALDVQILPMLVRKG